MHKGWKTQGVNALERNGMKQEEEEKEGRTPLPCYEVDIITPRYQSPIHKIIKSTTQTTQKRNQREEKQRERLEV